MEQKKVIIIGAGIAGLSAAIRLAENNFNVSLYEARNYIGGRFRSFTDKTTGGEIDNGQHIMVGAYTDFFGMLKKLGTDNLLSSQNSLKIPFFEPDGSKHILDAGKLPGKAGMLLGLLKLSGISLLSKYQALKIFLKIQSGLIETSSLNCLDFLHKEGQPDDIIRIFWEPLILATLNLRPELASAQSLVTVLKKAFFGPARNSRIYIPAVGLSKLIEPVFNFLKNNNSEIILKQRVRRIAVEKNKVQYIETVNQRIDADYYIFAAPPEMLLKILDNNPGIDFTASLYQYTYSSILSVYLWFDRPINFEPFAAVLDSHIQWIFNRRKLHTSSNNQIEKYPGHLTLTISAANDAVYDNHDFIINQCLSELKQVIPELQFSKLLHYKIIKEKKATISVTHDKESKRLPCRTLIKNLFLAGDWTKTGLPATLESAATSGKHAAEKIIKAQK